MKRKSLPVSFVCVALLALLAVMVGCQMTVPGCGPCSPGGACGPCGPCAAPRCGPPQCLPQSFHHHHLHLHHSALPAFEPPPPLNGQSARSQTMPLTVAPTELLAKACRGLAELIAATDQFQTETNLDAAEALDQHCHWPEVFLSEVGGGTAPKLTAPLCLVTFDPDQVIAKKATKLAAGEHFLQIALVESPAIEDSRDRFTDAANRWGLIMRQALALAARRDQNHWWMTGWRIEHPPVLNDIKEYPFANAGGSPVRVRVFPSIVTWQG